MTDQELSDRIHEICLKYYTTYTFKTKYNMGLSVIERRVEFADLIEAKAKEEINVEYHTYKYQLDLIVGHYNNIISDSYENK